MKKLLTLLLIVIAAYTTQAQLIPLQTQLDTLAARQWRQNQGFGNHISALYGNNGTRQAEIRSLKADSVIKTAQIASLKIDSANKKKSIDSLFKLIADGIFTTDSSLVLNKKTKLAGVNPVWLNKRYVAIQDYNNLILANNLLVEDLIKAINQVEEDFATYKTTTDKQLKENTATLKLLEEWRKNFVTAIKLLPSN